MIKRYFATIALSLLIGQGAIYGAGLTDNSPKTAQYLLFGKSMFDFSEGTNTYLSGGTPLSYTVDITFDGSGNATMDGIMGTRSHYNAVIGKYDSQTRCISFNTPLDYITSFDDYALLDSSEDFETVLCGIKPYGIGYIDPLATLTFTISEDGRTIYPSSGFGAGAAYLINEETYIISDYMEAIYDAILLKKESGVSFNIDNRRTDIGNTFPNLPISTGFRIYNTGDEASDYVVASSSPLFSISNPAGILAPGEFADIEIVFKTAEPGDYLTKVTVTNEATDITFDVKALCVNLPDYSKIVKEGEFVFSTDATFPWVISDKYGESPVAVNTNTGQERTTSPLYADVEISEKHAGILSWEGYCDPYHPQRDAFVVLIDGEAYYISPDGGGKTNSQLRIAPGSHRVEFDYMKGPIVNGTFATGKDYAWIRNLSLKEVALEQKAFRTSDSSINFQPKTIVKKGATEDYEIQIMNEGWEQLEFLDAISDNDAFSAELPSAPISTFETAGIKVKFHTYEPGKHNGNVTIRTSAGDIKIKCSAEAVKVPDFSSIVNYGDFDFDTTISHPFKVEDKKAFNSTSKVKDRRQTSSMLKADFDIPEGYYGELAWNARVSCAGVNDGEVTDHASIFIDSEETSRDFYGETVASQFDFAPAQVNLYHGHHFVCFSYSQSGDAKFEGDDRIEVSGLGIGIKKMNEREVRVWGSNIAKFEDVRITKVYQREIKLANFGVRPLQITGSQIEGNFEVEYDSSCFYNSLEEVPVNIIFTPEQPGTFNGCVTLMTTAGEVRIECQATVVNDPATLLFEDFEDDLRLWKFIDGDGDDATWDRTQMVQNAYHGETALQSYSIHADFTESPIDDIALSPEFTVPAGGATLSFYLACYNPSTSDRLKIYAGEGEDYENYQLVEDFNLRDVKPYYNLYECTLDDFEGKKIRLAFRHALITGVMSFIAIDDVIVSSEALGGISAVSQDIVNVEYYNLQGLKVKNPSAGVFIRKTCYGDGSVVSEKVMLCGN